jgi:glycosyltransferase involved in cell wall biosynthesis
MTHLPIKVLWVSCVGEKGGGEVYMLNLLRHFDRLVVEPGVALLRPGPLAGELENSGIRAFVLPAHRLRNPVAVANAIGSLKRIVMENGYSVVHSNGFRAHAYGGLAAWRAGVPEVWSTFTLEKKGILTRAILGIPTTHVAAICPRTCDFFLQQGKPTSLIWPGVDIKRLRSGTSREELARRYRLPLEGRWVIQAARLQRYKGQEFLLRALASLPPRHSNVCAVVIGGALFGQEEDFLEELKGVAARLGIESRVVFAGFVNDEDLHGFIAASDLVIHPALDEDFGLIVAEAQALEKAVLAYASVGPEAIIADGETGRLIPVGDQSGLNATLSEMLDAPEKLRHWGRAGRTRVERLFTADKSAREMERVYRACLIESPEVRS